MTVNWEKLACACGKWIGSNQYMIGTCPHCMREWIGVEQIRTIVLMPVPEFLEEALDRSSPET